MAQVLVHDLENVVQDGRPQVYVQGEQGAGVGQEGLLSPRLGGLPTVDRGSLWNPPDVHTPCLLRGGLWGRLRGLQVQARGFGWGLGGGQGECLGPADDREGDGVLEQRGRPVGELPPTQCGRARELEGQLKATILLGLLDRRPRQEVELALQIGRASCRERVSSPV